MSTLKSAALLLLLTPLAAHAQQGQCGLVPPGPGASTPASATPARDMVVSPPSQEPPKGLTPFPPEDVARMPALQAIARAGAKLYELTLLPDAEGWRTVFAINGTSFQLFYVPPHGGIAVRGIAQGRGGENLSEEQTKDIPGVVPTVAIRDGAPLVDGSVFKTAASTTHGMWGREGAPLVYVFIDPLCAYSLRTAQLLRPAVEAGRVRVALIPVAVIDHETQGRSTPAAEHMLTLKPDEMATDWLEHWQDWAQGNAAGKVDPHKLRNNQAAARAIKLAGTPTLVWLQPDGTEGRLNGVPADLDRFLQQVGG